MKGGKWEVDIQVVIQTGYSFSENWIFKTLARAYRIRGGNEPKKGGKYRKLTLFVQVSRGCFIAESPCLWGFLVFGVRKKGGGRYPCGYMEGTWGNKKALHKAGL